MQIQFPTRDNTLWPLKKRDLGDNEERNETPGKVYLGYDTMPGNGTVSL